MTYADTSSERNRHINSMTSKIVWGSIMLCAFVNLILVAHAAFYAAGALSIVSLLGFLTLTAQFHVMCIVLSLAAISLAIAAAYLDRSAL